MPHFSLIEDEEEKEKKKKRERNYNRLERFRSSDIMSLKRRVDRHLEDLQDIYKNYLKPYEKLDDTYRSRLNKIYSSHTSAGDKWANFWDGFASVADSFITAFAIAVVVLVYKCRQEKLNNLYYQVKSKGDVQHGEKPEILHSGIQAADRGSV